MFIRAVWRTRRLIDVKQSWREVEVPTVRDAVLLPRPPRDFAKMTHGLFDR